MADLSTTYMGLKLKNPIVVSSSDLTATLSGIKKCEDAGAGAVVMKSLFEEQFWIREEEETPEYAVYPEALDYMRSGGLLEYAPDKICGMIEDIKKAVDIPVIASINCRHEKLWPRFARQCEQAGADALELNIYFLPMEIQIAGSEYEDHHLRIFREVKKELSIPISVKLTHQITAVPHLGQNLAKAGCLGLVLFNWFMEPDIDIDKMAAKNLKGKGDLGTCLRWTALTAGRLDCDIAASGGVQSSGDVIKLLLAGASVVQVCSLLYQKGVEEIKNLLQGLETWMDAHRNSEIEDFRGEMSFKNQELRFRDLGEAQAFFRAQYLKAYTK